MEDRAEALRRRIALYREHLSRGVDVELAQRYLREIANAEAELERIGGRDPSSARSPAGTGGAGRDPVG